MGSKGRVSKSLYTRVVSKMVELVSHPFNLLTSRDIPI